MIKKISVLLLCSFSIIVSSYSQKFKGGLHLGILGTQVDGDFKGRYNKLGLFTGAFAAFPFHDETMSIQLEINYAQKGSKSQEKFPDGTLNKSRISLHQIEMPVLYNYMFVKNLSAIAGLSFNLLVDKKVYGIYGDLDRNSEDDFKFKFFELGALAGLTYLIKEHYGLSFRYGYSLTPIGISHDTRPRLIKGLRNNFLQFHFSYQF
ncbi:MAG: porin family protein [Bacteroidales bacterium]|jgi:hypothetical protein|nr:PorT family protein [Bacteroidales bacterium]